MGTAMYTDAWSTQGKPLTDDSPASTSGIPSSATTRPVNAAVSSGSSSSLGDTVAHWAEQAFGPAVTGVGRELGAMAQKLTAPGQMKNPWAWIGAAGLVGYVLGRSGALRPIASFAVRHAFSTLVDRALRGA